MPDIQLDVTQLGQVFTSDTTVRQMLALRQNNGRCLEPSAGEGAFSRHIPGCVAIELDAQLAAAHALHLDFFDYPADEKFDTVIGNPPYVRYQDITASTKAKLSSTLFDGRANLFLFFIEKAVKHLRPGGELIFVVPRELAKLTAAKKLNAWLLEEGSFTHFIETGDARIFKGAAPNCVIFRYVRGLKQSHLADGRRVLLLDGQLVFVRNEYSVPLSSLFDVKVGAVSGADDIFYQPEGNLELVCSETRRTGSTRRAHHGGPSAYLETHKERLMARRIRQFDESNWWEWGRGCPKSDGPRIYVNAKTRQAEPFFTHPCTKFDGSILALFPKVAMDIQHTLVMLNQAIDWQELGFVCDGRYLFSQRTLQTVLLPSAVVKSMLAKPS